MSVKTPTPIVKKRRPARWPKTFHVTHACGHQSPLLWGFSPSDEADQRQFHECRRCSSCALADPAVRAQVAAVRERCFEAGGGSNG
jgi:hypothetical protein